MMDQTERLLFLKKSANLSEQQLKVLRKPASIFRFDHANRMIENAIGMIPLPIGIATNFIVNGKKYLVPMAIEEPSVIAASSKAAKIAKKRGGFTAVAQEPLMIGQIQLIALPFPPRLIIRKVLMAKKELLEIANAKAKSVNAVDLQVRTIEDSRRHGQIHESNNDTIGKMLSVEIIVNTKDAMGANAVNTMCEAISPRLEKITGTEAVVKVLSNYSTRRIVSCRAVFSKEELGGKDIVERIIYSYAFAYSDVYRAVTHNKGIMNGIDAVALATGQDFRAIEAAAHAYAAREGTYRSMTKWKKTKEGDLEGRLELPISVGIVGGVTSVQPTAALSLKILNVKSAQELAMVMAAVGLAQNLAALRALSAEGIQKGHMRLHARNIAASAGARGHQIDTIAKILANENNITISRAKQVLAFSKKK